MKRGTIEHPKTKKLASVLKIPLAQAVGHLEALWHYTAKYALQGDVGRWTNAEIAQGSLWEKDADRFINALIECGWLDHDSTRRLITHDWAEHADLSAKKTLSNKGLSFFSADSIRPEPRPEGMVLAPYIKGSGLDCNINKGGEYERGTRKDQEQEIFAYWQKELNHPKCLLDAKRSKAIRARLAEGYSVDRIKQAIRGIKKSSHHMGQNDSNALYDDIELICRSGANVDRFAEMENKKGKDIPEWAKPENRKFDEHGNIIKPKEAANG